MVIAKLTRFYYTGYKLNFRVENVNYPPFLAESMTFLTRTLRMKAKAGKFLGIGDLQFYSEILHRLSVRQHHPSLLLGTMGDRIPAVAVGDGTQVELDICKAYVYYTPREKWNKCHGSV